MKGIILAGGKGTRLYPLTKCVSKQLLPIYDKPAIYYPLSTLMMTGIQDILIISTPSDLPIIRDLLGDGSELGMRFSYIEQKHPEGIAQAFVLGADFIGKDPVCLILGDNLIYGDSIGSILGRAAQFEKGAKIFAYRVTDPERYGVVEFDEKGKVLSLEEKPKAPRTSWAVPGLYFYDSRVVELAKNLKPSKRGELEITDLNLEYFKRGELFVEPLGRGIAWLDSGTYDSLLQASQFVQTLEQRQGLKVACIEEIAFHKGYINSERLIRIADRFGDSPYSRYIRQIVNSGTPNA
ncbi:glucose-1-phosphate thymidylyltransferase RfbA [bacterium]|nr:glucose-1-phosphate thymidylyltransferase RfbA [bacterium]